jgi:signal peptidase II
LKRFIQGWGWVPLVAILMVVVDQISKNWIRANVAPNSYIVPIPALEPWFKIVHWNNTGAAFGIMQGQGGIFIVIAVVVIVAALVYLRYLPAGTWLIKLCLALQLGGAAGNLIDRIQFGQVTDFVLLTLPVNGRVLQWPAFNVADSSIVVGVILLAFLLLREDGQRSKARESEHPAESAATTAEEQQ